MVLDSATHDRLIEGGIRLVKAGEVAKGRASLERGVALLAQSGCTEISAAFGLETTCQGVRLHDSNLSLARALLRRLGRTPRF